ncbi:MAG TPA: hypothetical protein VH164_10940 [Ktedonobacteraceae bacterium]|nr:hypothetical protein [Ktedonobacteraceae bacterium]
MRGKLRDKRDVKQDRLKRELLGRRPSKRENRNLHLVQQANENVDDDLLEEEGELTITETQQN